MNELVFIGQDLDKETLLKELTGCLLQENEYFLYEHGIKVADPFPKNI